MLLHSGLSLSASLHALHDIPGSSASLKELARINRQQQAGMGLTDALDELYERVPHRLVELFANAIKQAKITGSSLADTLQKQAQQCREQELLAAEKRAQEVSVKLLFPLLTCFFPVTFLLILGPVFIGFSLE
nr:MULTISPECIES: type II secretion system F family protein [unclassified Idiomarina]